MSFRPDQRGTRADDLAAVVAPVGGDAILVQPLAPEGQLGGAGQNRIRDVRSLFDPQHQRALGPSLALVLVLGLLDPPRDRDDRIAALELGHPGDDVLDDVGRNQRAAKVGLEADIQGGSNGHGFVPRAVVVLKWPEYAPGPRSCQAPQVYRISYSSRRSYRSRRSRSSSAWNSSASCSAVLRQALYMRAAR